MVKVGLWRNRLTVNDGQKRRQHDFMDQPQSVGKQSRIEKKNHISTTMHAISGIDKKKKGSMMLEIDSMKMQWNGIWPKKIQTSKQRNRFRLSGHIAHRSTGNEYYSYRKQWSPPKLIWMDEEDEQDENEEEEENNQDQSVESEETKKAIEEEMNKLRQKVEEWSPHRRVLTSEKERKNEKKCQRIYFQTEKQDLKINRMYEDGILNRFQRWLSGYTEYHCDWKNREKYVSSHLRSLDLWKWELSDEEVRSVEGSGQMSSLAFFMLTFEKVAKYNNSEKSEAKRAVLLHQKFFKIWLEGYEKNSPAECQKLIDDHTCFASIESNHYIIPIVMEGQYAVVELKKKGKKVIINVYDPKFGQAGVQISGEMLQSIGSSVFGHCKEQLTIVSSFADKNSILEQDEDGETNCDILTLMNIEAMLWKSRKGRESSSLMIFYSTNSIYQERMRLGQELRGIMPTEEEKENMRKYVEGQKLGNMIMGLEGILWRRYCAEIKVKEAMYARNYRKLVKRNAKIDGKFKKGIWSKAKRMLGGSSMNQCDPKNREKYVSEFMRNMGLWDLSDEDVQSVEKEEEMYNCAFFPLVFNKIAKFNNSTAEQSKRVVMLHDQFFLNWKAKRNEGTSASPQECIENHTCFSNPKSSHYVIPVLMHHHYVVVEMRKEGKYVFVNVFDSMFGRGGGELTIKVLEDLAEDLFGKSISKGSVKVAYATKEDIFEQPESDTVNCGVFALMNVEALLCRTKKDETSADLVDHYLTNDIMEERARLAQELREIMKEEYKIRKTPKRDEVCITLDRGSIETIQCDAVVRVLDRPMERDDDAAGVIRNLTGNLLKPIVKSLKENTNNKAIIHGQTIVTDAVNMNKTKTAPIINVQRKATRLQEQYLRLSNLGCFEAAAGLEMENIAMPIMSAGEFQYNANDAAKVLLQSIFAHFEMHPTSTLRKFVISVKEDKMYEAMERVLGGDTVIFDAKKAEQDRKEMEKRNGKIADLKFTSWNNMKIGTFVKKFGDKREGLMLERAILELAEAQLDLAEKAKQLKISEKSGEISESMEVDTTPKKEVTTGATPEKEEKNDTTPKKEDWLGKGRVKSSIRSSEKKSDKKGRIDRINKGKNLMKKSCQKALSFREIATKSNGTIDEMVENAKILQEFTEEQIGSVVEQVLKQLNADIIRPKGIEKDEHAARQLCHVPFHLVAKKDDEKFESLNKLYPKLWREFCRLPEVEAKESVVEAKEKEGVKENEKKSMEEDIIEVVRQVYGEEIVEGSQGNEGLAVAVAKHFIRARRCTGKCPAVDYRDAANIRGAIVAFMEKSVMAKGVFDINNVKYTIDSKERTAGGWIRKHAACYQGLRTLAQRCGELKTLTKVVAECKNAIEKKDLEKGNIVKLMDLLPPTLREIFANKHMGRSDDSHHHQQAVEKKYGHLIAAYQRRMEKEREDVICDVCSTYSRADLVKKRSTEICEFALVPNGMERGDKVDCCRSCWDDITNGRLPVEAVKNGFLPEYYVLPEELKGLNAVEAFLIQRVRPVQKIFNLRSVEGKKTSMRACNGCLVLLPTTINETVEHVIDTLPSASNMIISVLTTWNKEVIVDMNRVIRALEWLKKNNHIYADINIDRKFRFEVGEHVVFQDENATEKDAESLINRKKEKEDDGHLLTQVVQFEEQPIREMRGIGGNGVTAEELYRMKNCPFTALQLSAPNLDLKCFPLLFPYGKGGMSGATENERQEKIHYARYLGRMMKSSNRSFATNMGWMCFSYGLKQQLALMSTQGVLARIGKGTTTQEFDPMDEKVNASMSSLMANIRGSPAYWKKVKLDLEAMVIAYGTPTWFVTLNPNEKKWEDLMEIYRKNTKEEINSNTIIDAISRDPTHFARYFRSRVRNFLNEVLLKDDGPLGKITHYFHRIEYQHRGTQHLHCLFWTENKPGPNARPSEITEFLDKHVTARMPNEEEEKEMYDVVFGSQRHWANHGKTCLRRMKYRGRFYTGCRFSFPRNAQTKTLLRTSKTGKGIPGFKKRDYDLARRANEVMVNDYSPPIILGWNGNSDVQAIVVGKGGNVIPYITSYTTKGESAKKKHDADGKNVELGGISRSKYAYTVGNTMMRNREAGALEVNDDMMGHQNYGRDCAVICIPNDHYDNRMRVLKKDDEMKEGDLVYMDNLIDTDYPNRPKALENVSFFCFCINFLARKQKQNKKRGSDKEEAEVGNANSEVSCDGYHVKATRSPFFDFPGVASGSVYIPLVDTGREIVRTKQKCPRVYLPQVVGDDEKLLEDYYRRLCVTFIPWRKERDLMIEQGNHGNYEKTWDQYLARLLKEGHTGAHADIKKFLSAYTDFRQMQKDAGIELDKKREALRLLKVDEDAEEELELQDRVVDEAQHNANKKKLNEGQTKIFNDVMDGVTKNVEGKGEAVCMFISGEAGTGKSVLIGTLADEVTLKYGAENESGTRPAVIIAAPTGIAALAVDGNTIHSVFGLEVQRGKDPLFQELGMAKQGLKETLFSNVKLVIIDEISMVSDVMLMKIHLRLQAIKKNDKPFGGVNIVVLGDLLQLPPVMSDHVFCGVKPEKLHEVFGTMHTGFNLWHQFGYFELLQNMRQQSQLPFAELLGRMRIQSSTNEDIELLKGRVITYKGATPKERMDELAEYFVKVQKGDDKTIALFPTNEKVKMFTAAVMKALGQEVIIVKAIDQAKNGPLNGTVKRRPYQESRHSIVNNKRTRKQMQSEADESDPQMNEGKIGKDNESGLPMTLKLAIGGRVMLRRNMSIRDKLVNGATGVLESVDRQDGDVVCLKIRFDKTPEKVTPIYQVNGMYTTPGGEVCVRLQFPVVMAYAATIHKSQGMTLKNVIISTDDIFSACQFYVAASRVTSLEGLHFANWDPSKIKTDLRSLEEYNRLRKKIGIEEVAAVRKIDEKAPSKKAQWFSKVVVTVGKEISKKLKDLKKKPAKEKEPEIMTRIPRKPGLEEGEQKEDVMMMNIVHSLNMMKDVGIAMRKMHEAGGGSGEAKIIQLALASMFGNAMVEPLVVECYQQLQHDNRATTGEMMETIAKALPRSVADLFTFTIARTGKCGKCKYPMKNEEENYCVNLQPGTMGGKMQEVLERDIRNSTKKEGCDESIRGKKCGGEVTWESEIRLPKCNEYVVVIQHDCTTSFIPPDNGVIKIGGEDFEMIGVSKRLDDDDGEWKFASEQWYNFKEKGWMKQKNDGKGELMKELDVCGLNIGVFKRKSELLTRKENVKMVERDDDDLKHMIDVQEAKDAEIMALEEEIEELEAICETQDDDIVEIQNDDGEEIDEDASDMEDIDMEDMDYEDVDDREIVGRSVKRKADKMIGDDQRENVWESSAERLTTPFLPLINKNEKPKEGEKGPMNCFMNTVVNMLYACEGIRIRVLHGVDGVQDMDNVSGELHRLFSRRTNDVKQLREKCNCREGTGDYANTMFECTRQVAEKIAEEFRFLRDIHDPDHTRIRELMLREDRDLQELLNEDRVAESGFIGIGPRYHIINLNRDRARITGISSDDTTVRMEGNLWRVVAFAEYIRSEVGHYMAHIVEKNNMKTIIDDDHVKEISDDWNIENYEVNGLILERMEENCETGTKRIRKEWNFME